MSCCSQRWPRVWERLEVVAMQSTCLVPTAPPISPVIPCPLTCSQRWPRFWERLEVIAMKSTCLVSTSIYPVILCPLTCPCATMLHDCSVAKCESKIRSNSNMFVPNARNLLPDPFARSMFPMIPFLLGSCMPYIPYINFHTHVELIFFV